MPIKTALRHYIKRIKFIMANYRFIISGLVLLVSFDLDVILNVTIFGFPGILFMIRRTSANRGLNIKFRNS